MGNDDTALEEVKALGFNMVPVTVIGGKAIPGFSPNEIMAALQTEPKTRQRGPEETIPVIERALEAVARAVRQMPDDKLLWNTAVQKRPMRTFTWHIFERIEHTVQELGGGNPPRGSHAAESKTSFREVAEYGDAFLNGFRAWASRQDLNALRTIRLAGPNARTGAELLDVMAGHTVHHLRQLYTILREWGMTPAAAVPDSEWPPEYVLQNMW